MTSSYERINKQELEAFYRTHTINEVTEQFKISKTQLRRVLNYFNIEPNRAQKKHEKIDEIIAMLDIEAFKSDFNILTQKSLAQKYNLSLSQTKNIITKLNLGSRLVRLDDYLINATELANYYNSHTPSETLNFFNISNYAMLRKLLEKYNIPIKAVETETLENLINRIDYNELKKYYNTHTFTECEEYFQTGNLRKLLKYYNIDFKTKTHESLSSVLNRINTDDFILDFNNNLTQEEIRDKYNISYTMYRNIIRELNLGYKPHLYTNTSVGEREILEFIKSILPKNEIIIYHDTITLDGQELDIYIPNKKIAIEYNGAYWHSDLFKTKKYHLNKSKMAEKQGIRLIHIYDYE